MHFLARHPELIGQIEIGGLGAPIAATKESVAATAAKYLCRRRAGGRIFRFFGIAQGPGAKFITKSRWTRPTSRRPRLSCW